MATKTSNEQKLKPESWFVTKLPSPSHQVNSKSKDMMHEWLRDFTSPYYSPLKPIFTSQISTPKSIEDYEAITLRDGLVPFLWFLRQNPSHKPFCNQFLIHHSLKDFITKSWQQFTHLYALDNTANRKAPKKVLIAGHIADSYCGTKDIDHMLGQLETQIKKYKLSTDQVDIFMPILYDPFYVDELETANTFHLAQGLLSIFKKFGKNWSPLEFNMHSDFSDYSLFELNSNMLFADSSATHRALRKNSFLLNPAPEIEPNFSVPLSPAHQINIYQSADNTYSKSKGDALLESFNEIYTQEYDDPSEKSMKEYRMPEPTTLSFPAAFFRYIRDHYK